MQGKLRIWYRKSSIPTQSTINVQKIKGKKGSSHLMAGLAPPQALQDPMAEMEMCGEEE